MLSSPEVTSTSLSISITRRQTQGRTPSMRQKPTARRRNEPFCGYDHRKPNLHRGWALDLITGVPRGFLGVDVIIEKIPAW